MLNELRKNIAMIISPAEKYLFIRIPKTAGTAVTAALLKCKGQGFCSIRDGDGIDHEILTHSGALQMQGILGNDYRKFFRFSVVRNPWDRMVSLYHFKLHSAQQRLSGKRKCKPGLTLEDDNREVITMSTLGFKRWFLEGDCEVDMFGESLTRLPQLCWLTDESGQIIVDKVIRFEELEKGFDEIKARVTANFDVPKGTPSLRAPWQLYYDQESFECLQTRFASDIELLGYQTSWAEVKEFQDQFNS